jgi:C-methyltransferase
MTQLSTCVRTGRPAPILDEVGGTFGYLAHHPEQLAVFDDAMIAKAHADIAGILATVDFSRYATIADIGGGRGHLLRAITARHPESRGFLFDLPHVIEHVETDETGRVVCHPGDFFVDQLPCADLSILMQVIHDWDDATAQRILSAVAASASPGSSQMLFEWLLADQPTDDAANVLDMFMLAATGGRERTATEYTALVDQAGFDVVAIRQIVGPMFVIEARRR